MRACRGRFSYEPALQVRRKIALPSPGVVGRHQEQKSELLGRVAVLCAGAGGSDREAS